MSEALHGALNLDEDERKAKYEHLRDFVNANTSSLLVVNGQKTHVDLRLLLRGLFSGTRAQDLKTCMRRHKKTIRLSSLDLLGLEEM
ncbi:hypothetical protein N7535_001846 [Penicillium sp. DV-2018c]|nr:hypothetical protein N7461_004914 [Penicillium sp. DV-2018c]KAJ5583226.1 hypothetical protein N7535_001846 [Penicillium sp. DV-2018c]